MQIYTGLPWSLKYRSRNPCHQARWRQLDICVIKSTGPLLESWSKVRNVSLFKKWLGINHSTSTLTTCLLHYMCTRTHAHTNALKALHTCTHSITYMQYKLTKIIMHTSSLFCLFFSLYHFFCRADCFLFFFLYNVLVFLLYPIPVKYTHNNGSFAIIAICGNHSPHLKTTNEEWITWTSISFTR